MVELVRVGKMPISAIQDYPDALQYVSLSDGLCHYTIDGPDNGECVVMIHGATVPAWEFDRLVPYLNNAGYKTLRADLYGHGYSDRPAVACDISLFTRQITELLQRLKITAPVHVLGHSLGAAVAASLLASAPQRYSSLVLAAPMVNYAGNLPIVRLLRIPCLGECLMHGYVMPMLIRRRTRRYREIEDGRFVQKFKNQLLKPGFASSLLSMFRANTLGDQLDRYKAAAGTDVPVLILRGEHDRIVTHEQAEQLSRIFTGSGYRKVDDTAHAFLLTDPDRLAPIIINFIRSVPVNHTNITRQGTSLSSNQYVCR